MAFDISALPPGLVREPEPARSGPTDQLGQEEFLKLMLAQLKNQDPLQPLENGEFLGQIAQFGTVTGIQDLQNIMSGLSSNITSDRSLRAASLLDRQVLVAGTSARMDEEGLISGAVELNQPADSVRIDVLDLAGRLVGTVQLGGQGSGLNNFNFRGFDAEGQPLPAGTYQIRATATANGKPVALQTFTLRQVAGVQINPGASDLTLDLAGGDSVLLGDVRRID